MKNFTTRMKIRQEQIRNYEVAEALSMSISSFYLMLQKDLSDDQMLMIDKAIRKIKAGDIYEKSH